MTHSSSTPTLSPVQSIAFIDGAVGVCQRHGGAKRTTLMSGIQADRVVILDSSQNGIEQISDYLSRYTGVESLSIFSHGYAGGIQLGNTVLDNNSLDRYRDDLADWGRSLSADGDMLFFGCNVGRTDNGKSFVNSLHQITGADIAVSDDLTGLGGDWDLEVQVGIIGASTLLSAEVQAQYQNTLATTIGESGQVTNLKHRWQTITLDHSYDNPVVVAGPPSRRGAPSTVRVRNVTANSFEMRIDEWEYLDGRHTIETVGYVVIEAGTHILEDGTVIAAGTQTQVNHRWQRIPFEHTFESQPIVLAQTTSENEPVAVSERLRIETNSFEIKLQEEEAADRIHADESIGWLAIQPGSGMVGTSNYTSGTMVVNHRAKTVEFDTPFDTAPVLLAEINTFHSGDPVATRFTQLSNEEFSLLLEEEKSKNTEVKHVNESVGFLALDAGLITVGSAPNQLPTITSNGGAASVSVSVAENTRTIANIDATDPDGDTEGNGLTYSLAGQDISPISIDPNTGVLSFDTAPDYEVPTDSNGDNQYNVDVVVTDSQGGQATQSITVTVTNEVSVFLLGGQSNMAGRAFNSTLSAPLFDPYPAVQIWQDDIQGFSNLRPGFGGELRPGDSGAAGNGSQFGPELTFGRSIDGVAPEEVFLIKYAEGGTSLAEDWAPEGSNNVDYDLFNNRVSDALAALANNNVGYSIEGMLWMQGERDTRFESFANAYAANLIAFIADMRDRYGANLRFVIGKLSPSFSGAVPVAQETVAVADPRNYIVNTDAFELLSDQIHYSTNGTIDLGIAFADVLKDTFTT